MVELYSGVGSIDHILKGVQISESAQAYTTFFINLSVLPQGRNIMEMREERMQALENINVLSPGNNMTAAESTLSSCADQAGSAQDQAS